MGFQVFSVSRSDQPVQASSSSSSNSTSSEEYELSYKVFDAEGREWVFPVYEPKNPVFDIEVKSDRMEKIATYLKTSNTKVDDVVIIEDSEIVKSILKVKAAVLENHDLYTVAGFRNVNKRIMVREYLVTAVKNSTEYEIDRLVKDERRKK